MIVHPTPVEAAAPAMDERVRALADMGFTERQARFLVLVMRHAGVCIPRQYAGFAGIANGGRKCNAFFARLVRRGLAAAIGCVHNRARLYHVHARGLYAAIGEGSSRYRRAVPAGRTAERLMLLDAVLTTPDLDWLTTAGQKRAYLARLTGATSPERATDSSTGQPPATVRDLPGALPIGIDPSGRVVLLYLATDPWTDRFRTFLQGHARLLRVAPTWTIRLAFPHPLEHFYSACQSVIHDELESPLHPATVGELQWFFEHRRQSEAGEPLQADVQVRDVALGERDDVDAGKREALEQAGSVFLVPAEAIERSAMTMAARSENGAAISARTIADHLDAHRDAEPDAVRPHDQ